MSKAKVIVKRGMHVRSEKSMSSKSVRIIPYGAVFDWVEEYDGWLKVKDGWVRVADCWVTPVEVTCCTEGFEGSGSSGASLPEGGTAGQVLVMGEDGVARWQTIDTSSNYNIGDGLVLDKDTNTLSVDISDDVADSDERPVSSTAVNTEIEQTVGVINELLDRV